MADTRPVTDAGDAIVPGTRPATFVETIDALWHDVDERLRTVGDPQIARCFALAKTSLEDARVRYTEGRARQLGVFKPADLDRVVLESGGDEQVAAAAFLQRRDEKASQATLSRRDTLRASERAPSPLPPTG